MNCCQCQGIEQLFSQRYVNDELARYRAKGPDKTTRMLSEAIAAEGVEGYSLLDIGGGLGAIQHELFGSGVKSAIAVEASTAYLSAAKDEIQRRELADRVSFYFGNFVDLAEDIAPADIVTLDRVICCYPDMEQLVGLSARQARKLYGLVYPRDGWWMRFGIALENLFYRLRRNPYRAYIHPTKAVESVLGSHGFKHRSYRQTLAWQVAVYTR